MKRIIFYFVSFAIIALLTAMLLPAHTGGGPNDSEKSFALHDIRVLANTFKLSHESNKTSDTIHTSTNGLLSSCGFQFSKGLISKLRFNGFTNENGELLDVWQTPYQIEIISQTNFIVHSAGRDQKFGDADDIIFNSASNNFVKP
jgi:hypothetical protein